jgi:formyl-CoA transferase
MDPIIQAYSGWYDVNRGGDGAPAQMDHVPIDVLTGLYAYQAALAALLRRFRFGMGAQIEVSLVHAAAAFLAPRLHDHILSGGVPKREVGLPWGPYQAKEGLITLAVRGDAEFRQLCEAIGAPDLRDDERFTTRKARTANAEALTAALVAHFAAADAAAWEKRLRAAGIMCCRVRTVGDFLEEAHVVALGLVREFDQPGLGTTPYIAPPGFSLDAGAMGPAPQIGEHTNAVLSKVGLSPAECEAARG